MIRSCLATLLLLVAASSAAAQADRAELVLPPSAAGPELVRALQRAVHPLPSTLVTSPEPACPERAPTASTLRVALHAREGGIYRLCIVWGDQRAMRDLGPFEALDAGAREQISTIVEATVEALRPLDAEAATSDEPATMRFLLSAGYAPSLLASSHYAHGVATELGLELSPLWFVALHLAYTFPTTISGSGATASANALSARAAVGGTLPLGASFALQALLGVTVERLAVQAGTSSSQELQSATPRTAVDPWLTAQIGARLALHPSFWLSARVGADLAFTPREFGFERGDTFVSVLDSGPVRVNFELQTGLFL